MKNKSVFYTESVVSTVRNNIEEYVWASDIQRQITEKAKLWMKFSDDELWDAVFGHNITRSWMVWSNGYCPACQKEVPMYGWRINAFKYPWKVRCPHCCELFPKNDFYEFYRSGLDEHGVFSSDLANRSLLFNIDHPGSEDSLNLFGVDDGEGYVDNDKRWRFIGAYLIYGQWKQFVLGGIKMLSSAYTVTGDSLYAHKACVLLDRVADLYPAFDFATQGLAYERPHGSGYVSTWHDACYETREMALAYDQVFEALKADRELVTFLARKAKEFNLSNPKASFEDIQKNIESGIFLDALQQPDSFDSKIFCNFPQPEITITIIKIVLGWPENLEAVLALVDSIVERTTAVDGLSGEKGLTNYSPLATQGLAVFLQQFSQVDPMILSDLIKRHPQLRETYRFHIDTWCLQKYYPLIGDCGYFAASYDEYQGVHFQQSVVVDPLDPIRRFDPSPPVSMYSLLWRLYELTGDEAYVQVLYHANKDTEVGLPYDLFVDNPEAVQQKIERMIAQKGMVPRVGSINKEKWHLAILRSGSGKHAHALWMNYDAGRFHSHADGMNIGLFAEGLDLAPDFGYPPVGYGGWDSPKAKWYKMSAAHNTVVVDGKNHEVAAARTTLWADGEQFRAIRVSGPDLIGGTKFERTVALIDVSEQDFYVVDVFRVVGGRDHAKFFHSALGKISTKGLVLKDAAEYGHDTQMRHFRVDSSPEPGWSVDWSVAEKNREVSSGSEVHLRYTDLTVGAQAYVAEGWISTVPPHNADQKEEAWIPFVVVRRNSEREPLESTFVTVLEPYQKRPSISEIRRLTIQNPEGREYGEEHVAIEICHNDGSKDCLIMVDAENQPGGSPTINGRSFFVQRNWDLQFQGEFCMVRLNADRTLRRIVICNGDWINIGSTEIKVKSSDGFTEIGFE